VEAKKTRIGTVVKHTGSHYLISELPTWDLHPVVIRGSLRLKGNATTNPIAVGDHVEYEMPLDLNGEISGTGSISKILPRKNYIIRKSTNLSRQAHIIAANIDLAYLVVTLDFPETKWPFIDRFLVTCQAYNVPVKILLNKIDLYGESHRELINYFKEVYHDQAGYEIIEISATKGINIQRIKEECAKKDDDNQVNISLFSGVSGVGKSSLIRALDPSIQLKTNNISSYHIQGKHTTTFYEMYKLETGGFIIDTPGIRGFGLIDVEKEEISTYFPEMFHIMNKCRFQPCTHTHEPGCAVKQAVENGEISYERYKSYLGMLDDESKYR